jgi:S-DNA-T family DNA segregation ATPase FtsK/SpoIIIE
VSLLQRRLAIGYTRSSRLIDLMGIAGIISDHKGSVARDVLITPIEWEAMKRLAAEDETRQQSAGTLFQGEGAERPAGTVEPKRVGGGEAGGRAGGQAGGEDAPWDDEPSDETDSDPDDDGPEDGEESEDDLVYDEADDEHTALDASDPDFAEEEQDRNEPASGVEQGVEPRVIRHDPRRNQGAA